MKRHPVFLCSTLAAVILTAGVFTAYYNTKTYAFDEEAVLFSADEQGFSVMDFKIYYEDIRGFARSAKRAAPQEEYTTAPYIVPNSGLLYDIMYMFKK